MGSDASGVEHASQNSSFLKVHSSICRELEKILKKIGGILPAIESARPGCSAGIQELCNLNNTVKKAELLIQHCTESSKLYLAITSDSVVSRCERIRKSLDQSLFFVQNMVPQTLAFQISGVLEYLRKVKFIIESSEEEAGNAILGLLRQTDSNEEQEFIAFQTAVASLKIKSAKALLIERRSIKKLLDKIHGTDPKKEKILNYFLYLIKKYSKKLVASSTTGETKEDHAAQSRYVNFSNQISSSSSDIIEHISEYNNVCEAQTDTTAVDAPPDEYCCPISSKLMYDPVVIDSGQTYERVFIVKWFNEGNVTCPKTKKKLKNFNMVQNSCLKDLITSWCRKHKIDLVDPSLQIMQAWDPPSCTSVSSLRNVSATLLDGRSGDYAIQSDISNVSFISSEASYCSESSNLKGFELFSFSDDFSRCQTFYDFSYDMYLRFFYGLSELQTDHRDKAVDDMKLLFAGDEELCYAMISNGFVDALINFLEKSHDLSEVHMLKTGAMVFLAFLSNNRVEIPYLNEGTIQLLSTLLESEITLEALMILQKLARHLNSKSIIAMSGLSNAISNFLDSGNHDILQFATEIILSLSKHKELKPHVISSGCIQKVVPLLTNQELSTFCLQILLNLVDSKEACILIAEANECIALISELLEIGSREDKEHSVAILHSVCSQSLQYCLLVMKEGVIPSLVDISVNGTSKSKEHAMKLLHLFKDIRLSGSFENSSSSHVASEEINNQTAKKNVSFKQPSSKSSGFLGRKLKLLLKPKSTSLS